MTPVAADPARDPLVAYAREVLALGRRLGAAAPERRQLSLPFVDVLLRGAPADCLTACDAALALDTAAAGTERPLLTLDLVDAASHRLPSPRLWWEELTVPIEIERRLAAAGLRGAYWHDTGMWTFYDLSARHGVQFRPAPGAWPPWEPSAPLRLFLAWAHAAEGRRLIHAATLGATGAAC